MTQLLTRAFMLGLLMLVFGSIVGCGSFNQASNRVAGVVSPYKIDIVQGNMVSREQREALKVGMSRLEVRDILGTPLLASVFHADRWDYVFTLRRQGMEPQARRLTVFFKDDQLARVEADALPSEAEFVASMAAPRTDLKVPVLQMSEEQLKATVAAPGKPAAAPALPPLPASYPPLEPPTR